MSLRLCQDSDGEPFLAVIPKTEVGETPEALCAKGLSCLALVYQTELFI